MDEKKETYAWGSHFYEQVSSDLRDELPGVKSFSPRNLLYMHQYYRLFPDAIIPKQAVSELAGDKNTHQTGAKLERNENTHQTGAELRTVDEIFMIPWGHIKLLIDKCKDDRKKALFYIHRTASQTTKIKSDFRLVETILTPEI